MASHLVDAVAKCATWMYSLILLARNLLASDVLMEQTTLLFPVDLGMWCGHCHSVCCVFDDTNVPAAFELNLFPVRSGVEQVRWFGIRSYLSEGCKVAAAYAGCAHVWLALRVFAQLVAEAGLGVVDVCSPAQ